MSPRIWRVGPPVRSERTARKDVEARKIEARPRAGSAAFSLKPAAPAASAAPGAAAQLPIIAHLRHPRFLDRPSQPRSQRADRGANQDSAQTTPRWLRAGSHAVG